MNTEQQRLWTAIVTPFLADDTIDYESFAKILRKQEAAGNGIVVLGSTGEGLALDDEERRALVRFTMEQKLKVPVMAGLGGFQLKSVLRWMSFCEEAGIQAFLAPVPLYAKPGTQGQIDWFSAILDHSKKPVMLYNVPSRTGVKLSVAALRSLGNHPQAWAVKEASGSVGEFLEYREAAPKMRFYAGDDGLLPSLAAAGAEGLVSVAGNVWPEATNRFVTLSLSGRTENLFPIWKRATDTLFSVANPIPVKALMAKKAWIRTGHMRAPLAERELSSIEALVEADQAIERWLVENR